jgi:hypothetical protein
MAILRVELVGSHGRWKRPRLPPAHMANAIERGPGGLTREVETPSPSTSPHARMILRVDQVGSSNACGGLIRQAERERKSRELAEAEAVAARVEASAAEAEATRLEAAVRGPVQKKKPWVLKHLFETPIGS